MISLVLKYIILTFIAMLLVSCSSDPKTDQKSTGTSGMILLTPMALRSTNGLFHNPLTLCIFIDNTAANSKSLSNDQLLDSILISAKWVRSISAARELAQTSGFAILSNEKAERTISDLRLSALLTPLVVRSDSDLDEPRIFDVINPNQTNYDRVGAYRIPGQFNGNAGFVVIYNKYILTGNGPAAISMEFFRNEQEFKNILSAGNYRYPCESGKSPNYFGLEPPSDSIKNLIK